MSLALLKGASSSLSGCRFVPVDRLFFATTIVETHKVHLQLFHEMGFKPLYSQGSGS